MTYCEATQRRQPRSEEGADARIGHMKISHFARQFFPGRGGCEDFVLNLAKQQIAAGHSVSVITCNRIFTRPNEILPREDVYEGVRIHRVPFWGSQRYPVAVGIRDHVAGNDVLHVHGVDFFFDFLAFGRLFHRVPMVATTHGGFFHTKEFLALKKVWFGLVTPVTAKGYDAIAACSPSDFRLFEGVCGKRLRALENGANVEKFSDASSRTLRKSAIVLGRFGTNKRLDWALNAFAALKAKDPDWAFHICGVDWDWTLSDLRREIRERDLANHTTVHYGLSDEELREVLAQCSFYVSASEYEGFALAMTEALSAGLQAVANKRNEVFANYHAKNGHVVLADFADADAAAEGIRAAYAKAAEDFDAMRSRSMEIAEKYSWTKAATRYETLYRQILNAKGMTIAPSLSGG